MKNQLILILVIIFSNTVHALPLNGCGTPTKNGYVVQTTNGSEPVSLVTMDQAKQIFEELKKPEYKIPYLNARTHCDLRAHKISQTLFEKWRLKTVKVYTEALNDTYQGAGAPAYTRGEFVENESWASLSGQDIAGEFYNWNYHTSSAICVRHNGEDRLYVLDLSLYHEPVSLRRWVGGLTSGLSTNQYHIYAKEMYSTNVGRYSQKITSFSREDQREVEKTLKADWGLHRQKVSTISTPLTNSKNVVRRGTR